MRKATLPLLPSFVPFLLSFIHSFIRFTLIEARGEMMIMIMMMTEIIL